MNNKCGVYKITSPSGRIYIGESGNIHIRWKSYKSSGCKDQPKLTKSFNKYGVENHSFEIIEECLLEELKCTERKWQDFYDATNRDKGLNCLLTECGEEKRVHSEETKLKISNTKKLRFSQGQVHPMLGNVWTEEAKKKLSEKRKINGKSKGSKNSCFGKFGKNHPAYGQVFTEVHRKAISERQSGGKNPNAKIVLDTYTGIFYDCAVDAAKAFNMNKYTLRAMLNGQNKNKTNLIYC